MQVVVDSVVVLREEVYQLAFGRECCDDPYTSVPALADSGQPALICRRHLLTREFSVHTTEGLQRDARRITFSPGLQQAALIGGGLFTD